MQEQKKVSNFLWPIISLLSAIVFAFLVWWIYYKPAASSVGLEWVSFLPYLNCGLNTLTAILLVCGVLAIRAGKRQKHQAIMISAGIASAIFLVSYLTYHHFQGDTKFLGQGVVRYLYFGILISHVLLSMIQVPLILGTFYLAFTKNWGKHKKVAKITFPIWLYVSVTGVLVFVFLKAFN